MAKQLLVMRYADINFPKYSDPNMKTPCPC